jgi:hypothetical protein
VQEKPASSALRMALAAVVFAGVGAGAAFAVLSRSGADDGAEAPVATAAADELLEDQGGAPEPAPEVTPSEDAAPTEDAPSDAAVASAEGDAGVEQAAERPAPSGDSQARPRPDRTPSRGAPEAESEAEEEMPAAVAQELRTAEAALRAGDFDGAIRAVERAERRQTTVLGYSIKARAYCAKYDLANARANWRNLPPRARQRVARFCADYDILL